MAFASAPGLNLMRPLVFDWLFRSWRLRQPFPPAWRAIVEDRLPFARELPPAERRRFENHLKLFAWRVRFEGAGGLTVDDEMRVVIAGQAARMARNLPYGVYDHLGSVVVYPSHYRHAGRDGIILGEAHRLGTLVLSWDAATQGLQHPHDGQDTTLHELAHILDAEDGVLDGTPLLETGYRQWATVLSRHFFKLRAHRDRQHLLRAYGATDEAEFFAVASEVFFEKPTQMKRQTPDLYRELQRYYRLDPAGSART